MSLKDSYRIVVLGDSETWDVVNNVTHIQFLNWQGEEELFNTGHIHNINPEHVLESVSLKELVDHWIKTR